MKKILTGVFCIAAIVFIAGWDFIPQGVPVEDVIKMAAVTHQLNEKQGLIPKNFSLHWTIDNTYKRKFKGENWKGVDVTFYYVSPSLGESSTWDKAQKKLNPWGGRNTFSNHSVRVFSGKIAYIKRGKRYDIEYFAGNDIATNPASLFHPVPHLWQYKTKNIPKNGSSYLQASQALEKVIKGYCRRAGIKGTLQSFGGLGYTIENVTKNENDALFPYKGICKFTTVTETKTKRSYVTETEHSYDNHEVEVYWSSITEDWLAFRYGSTICRCDRWM